MYHNLVYVFVPAACPNGLISGCPVWTSVPETVQYEGSIVMVFLLDVVGGLSEAYELLLPTNM